MKKTIKEERQAQSELLALRKRLENFRYLAARTRLWQEARDRQAAQLERLCALPDSPHKRAAVAAAGQALEALRLPAESVVFEEEKARITAAIEALEEPDRTLALSVFLLGKTYVAAGFAAGYSEDGVKKRMPRILSALAGSLETQSIHRGRPITRPAAVPMANPGKEATRDPEK